MEFKTQININNIDRVKEFCSIASSFDGDIMLHSDPYVIDGKSIMGIFSLDLSKDIEMILRADNAKAIDTAIDSFSKFIVDEVK